MKRLKNFSLFPQIWTTSTFHLIKGDFLGGKQSSIVTNPGVPSAIGQSSSRGGQSSSGGRRRLIQDDNSDEEEEEERNGTQEEEAGDSSDCSLEESDFSSSESTTEVSSEHSDWGSDDNDQQVWTLAFHFRKKTFHSLSDLNLISNHHK